MPTTKNVIRLAWYVKRKKPSKSGAPGGADCGPYRTEEEANEARDRRAERLGVKPDAFTVEETDIEQMHVRKRRLVQYVQDGKRVPARAP